jgi:hypothetical protein
MNHREPPRHLAGIRKALHCLLGMLLPATAALTNAHAFPRLLPSAAVAARRVEPTPYLSATATPPLRFQQPAPQLMSLQPATTPAPANAAAQTLAIDGATAPQSTAARGEPEIGAPAANPSNSAGETDMPAKSPTAILPDDVRPSIRPEEFLPYFQIPGSARQSADVTLLVPVPKAAPAPASIPPSSATYTQSPK